MKSSCLTVLLVYATQRTTNCVALAILIDTYQLVNDIRARRANACVHICSVTQQNSQDRASLQAQSAIQFWLDRESSYKRLSQLALDIVASPASLAYAERLFSLRGDLTARKRNSTKVSLCRQYF